jgi:hypothetical protein
MFVTDDSELRQMSKHPVEILWVGESVCHIRRPELSLVLQGGVPSDDVRLPGVGIGIPAAEKEIIMRI